MFDFPASPSNGQTVTGASGAVYTFDGTKWRAGGTSSRASLTIGDTPPVSPMAGELWWDSTGGQLFVWYADPNTSQWVIANSGPIASDAPNDARTYARQSRAWTDITATAAASPNNVGRNLLHNPLMAVSQRGAGPWTTNNSYTVDRWQLTLISDAASVTQQALIDADRTQIGDENATYCFRNSFTGNAAAGAYNNVQQGIEDVRRLAGKTVTVSFYAQAVSGTPKLGVSIDQGFGPGGSAAVNNAGQSVTLSTSWTRYSLTFAIPSAVGKTIGSTPGGNWLIFWFSSGSTNATRSGNIGVQSGTANIWGVQLEIGSVATPLDYGGSYADQLRACQRYYQTGTAGFFGYGTTGLGLGYRHPFQVTMRALPAITNAGSPTNASLSITATSQATELNIFLTVTATGAASWQGAFTASADL